MFHFPACLYIVIHIQTSNSKECTYISLLKYTVLYGLPWIKLTQTHGRDFLKISFIEVVDVVIHYKRYICTAITLESLSSVSASIFSKHSLRLNTFLQTCSVFICHVQLLSAMFSYYLPCSVIICHVQLLSVMFSYYLSCSVIICHVHLLYAMFSYYL